MPPAPVCSRALGSVDMAALPRNLAVSCHILPLLPPITRNVKLPLHGTWLEFPPRGDPRPTHNLKNGKNGNVQCPSQHCHLSMPGGGDYPRHSNWGASRIPSLPQWLSRLPHGPFPGREGGWGLGLPAAAPPPSFPSSVNLPSLPSSMVVLVSLLPPSASFASFASSAVPSSFFLREPPLPPFLCVRSRSCVGSRSPSMGWRMRTHAHIMGGAVRRSARGEQRCQPIRHHTRSHTS